MADLIQKEETTNTKTAYGKPLDVEIPYTFSWTEFPDFASLKSAGEVYSEDEQVKGRNTERKLAARNKAMNEALKAAGYEKPSIENSALKRYQDMHKIFMATGQHTDESARAAVEAALGGPGPTE
mgnify:CR=1 FL=1